MKSNIDANQLDSRTCILQHATFLFAKKGYAGLSMRELSKTVGMSTAAIYHYFPDKKTLYLEVMDHTFAGKTESIINTLNVTDTALQRLTMFIESFATLISSDPNYRTLLQWELLLNDQDRLELIAKQVFLSPFQAISVLFNELFPESDPHMLTISMVGLILFHFDTAKIRVFLPGWNSEHNDPKIISAHVMQFLFNGHNFAQDKTLKNIKAKTL